MCQFWILLPENAGISGGIHGFCAQTRTMCRAVALHEKVLDGHPLLEQNMLSLVGAAKAAGGNEAHDAVIAGIQQRTGL